MSSGELEEEALRIMVFMAAKGSLKEIVDSPMLEIAAYIIEKQVSKLLPLAWLLLKNMSSATHPLLATILARIWPVLASPPGSVLNPLGQGTDDSIPVETFLFDWLDILGNIVTPHENSLQPDIETLKLIE